jgi:hypothetical protein
MATTFMRFIKPSPRRVRVNLNAVSGDGFIRVRTSRADGPVEVGQLVEIFEPNDEIEGIAKVARISDRTGLMYLDVKWDTLHDLPPTLESSSTELGFGPATERSQSIFRRPVLAMW